MPPDLLIATKRIEAIGGLKNSEVQRILGDFVAELPGYVFLLESHRKQQNHRDLSDTLHRLKGAARTCGFIAIAKAAGDWHDAAEPFESRLLANLRSSIDASISEWSALIG